MSPLIAPVAHVLLAPGTGEAPEILFQIAYLLALIAGPLYFWYSEPPTYRTERAYFAAFCGSLVATLAFGGVQYGIGGIVAVIYEFSLALLTLACLILGVAGVIGVILLVERFTTTE